MITFTIQQVVSRAFREIAVYTPTMPVPADDMQNATDELNLFFDEEHNDRRLTYSQIPYSLVLTPGKNPHTFGNIGSGADITATNRPIDIREASIVMTDVTPNVYKPLEIKRSPWWYGEVPVRAVSTSLPSYLYYEPNWPIANIYLWPVPTLAYTLEMLARYSAFFNGSGTGGTWVLTDNLSLPPGYMKWVIAKLAKRLAPQYPGALVPPGLESSIGELEQKLFNTTLNVEIPELDLVDAGMPGGEHGLSGTMNYRSRTIN